MEDREWKIARRAPTSSRLTPHTFLVNRPAVVGAGGGDAAEEGPDVDAFAENADQQPPDSQFERDEGRDDDRDEQGREEQAHRGIEAGRVRRPEIMPTGRMNRRIDPDFHLVDAGV